MKGARLGHFTLGGGEAEGGGDEVRDVDVESAGAHSLGGGGGGGGRQQMARGRGHSE